MTVRRTISQVGIDLIKRYEGFRPIAARLPNGQWTIGYGHTKSARSGVEITEKDATDLLKYDLQLVERALNNWLLSPVEQNEFDALAALAWNIGLNNFKHSDVLSYVNSGEPLAAAESFAAWRMAVVDGRQIVVDGMVRRRAAEKALFLDSPEGPITVPSHVVQPVRDIGLAIASPEVKAYAINIPLNGTNIETPHLDQEEEDELLAPIPDERTASEKAAAVVITRLQKLISDQDPTEEGEAGLGREVNKTNIVTARANDNEFTPEGLGLSPISDSEKPETDQLYFGDNPDPLALGQDLEELIDTDEDTFSKDSRTGQKKGERQYRTRNDLNRETGVLDEVTRRQEIVFFGVLSLIAAILTAVGGVTWWRTLQSADTTTDGLYAGPFLILLGGIGLFVGLYYLIVAMVEPTQSEE